MSAIERLWDMTVARWTGTPYRTGRSMVAEFGPTFGPPPAVRYPELARYTAQELVDADRGLLLAEIERERAARRSRARQSSSVR